MENQFINFVMTNNLVEIKKNISVINLKTKNKALIFASEKRYIKIVKYYLKMEQI